jgi:glycosyltransferase involved in cell wall biosynthesis
MNRISAITICFNNLAELQATCQSVEAQEMPPFEHLIIDGSSTSDIRTWLEVTPQPAYRRWICERDNGIADAFNKGVHHFKGDITVHLNSGDRFYNSAVLQKVTETFENDPALQWLHGQVHLYRGGQWVTVGKPFEKGKLYRGMRSVAHQTMYVRRGVYDRRGLFDTGLRYSMDYDFLCRIAEEHNTFIPYPLATYDPHGISSTQYLKAMAEGRSVFRRYYSEPVKQALWGARLTLLYKLLHSPVGKTLYSIKARLGGANW